MTLSPEILRALRAVFPGDALITDPERALVFGADASRRFATPGAVVRPQNLEQIVELMRIAHHYGAPLYPRGRGTNRVGACVPEKPGIVVSCAKLDRIVDMSNEDFVAVCEPGVITGALQQAAKARGLLYAPDPASARYSTIGGNVAQNAGGMRALKYGTTRDWVLGVTAVLPGGTVARLGSRCHKDAAGLDLARLFAGSEGTLGFMADVTLKLLPHPEASASLMAAFSSEEDALTAARAVFASGILPVALEFMPEEVTRALEHVASVPWPKGSGAALLFSLDGSPEAVAADLSRLRRSVESARPSWTGEANTPADEESLWEPRRQVSQAAHFYGPSKLSDDIAVPRGKVGEAVARIRRLSQDAGLTVLAFGHLGDGNLHVSVMHDGADEAQARRAAEARQSVLAMALELDGTITGEHGVGMTKLNWLERMRGPETVALMRAVKAAFDPKGIMNPGKAY